MKKMLASKITILVLLAGFGLHQACRAADYGDAGAGPAPGWYETAEATDQGWDYDTAQWWYHVDQGTAFIPYEWFLALEQARGQELFRAPGNMERLGFFPNPPNNFNPHGLPVGFSRTELNLDKGPYQCWQGNWVGLTCAACHTGQVNFHGTRVRIEAGPAQNDIETFRDELSQALAATAGSSSKAKRFGMRVAAALGQPDPNLEQKLLCYLGAGRQRTLTEEQGLAAADEVPTPSGFGRLDALGRGGNFLFAESLGKPQNYEPTTAPVSFPALWDTPYFDWVLYNNSVRQPLARSIVEALGVGAPIDLSTLSGPTLLHHLQLDNIVDIQRSLLKVKSPKWPESILGPIDQSLATRGAEIYAQQCVGCHQLIDREAPRAQDVEFEIPQFDIEQVGTDPRQAVNFARREVALDGTAQPLGGVVKLVTDRIVGQYVGASPDNKQKADEINRGQPNDFQALEVYRARPLNGIWATAPYLHNGSVPDLVELLRPPAQRAKMFYVGNWEFDPGRVGFEWKSPFANAFLFDTRLPGNSNAGHEHGTTLSAEDRAALIEYLKTL